MRRSTICALLCQLLPLLTYSTAAPGGWQDWHHGDCLTDADAAFLVDIYISTTFSFDPNYVSQFFTDDFTVWSDSVNYLFKVPLQTPISTNKTAYISNTYSLITIEPQPPTKVQYVTHNCHEITARALQLDHPNVIAEIYLFEVRKEGGIWKLAVAYGEFNSAADAENIAAATAAGGKKGRRVRRGDWTGL